MTTQSHPVITALSASLADASDLEGLPVEEIAVERVEAVDWPDACLGIPSDGEACAEVVTPGFRVRLAGGLTYHTDYSGDVRRARRHDVRDVRDVRDDTEIRLSYTVLGGIGGWSTTLETDSHRLSEAENEELRQLIADADFFNVPNAPPTTVILDGFTRRLKISVGRRQYEVVRGDGIEVDDTEAFRALVAWVEERTPSIFGRLGRVDD